LTVTTAPGETAIEAGENMKFLMTIVSLVAGFWPADDPVAVALADAEVLELLLEQAVISKTRMSPGTHSQLR
jgi:hypothetical protein